MSLVLGIDTATRVAVGLARDGERVAAASVEGATAHVEQLMPLVTRLLADAGCSLADLTGIAVGLGPGPFTGLRVGIVTAQVLAASLRVPLRGVCSLDAVAARCSLEEFVVATDARRREVYWARYAAGRRVEGPAVGPAADLPALPVVGPGALLYHDVLDHATDDVAGVDAGLLAAAADRLPDMGAEPLYLRRPDAAEPGRRKSALTSLANVGRHRATAEPGRPAVRERP